MVTFSEGLDARTVLDSFGYLYRTEHRGSRLVYIGQSRKLTPKDLEAYLGSGDYLHKAIAHYGRDSFDKRVLATAHTQLDLDVLEIQVIARARAAGEELINGGVGGPRIQAPWLGQVARQFLVTHLDRPRWLRFVTEDEEDLREVLTWYVQNSAEDVDDFYDQQARIWQITQDLTVACPSCGSAAGELCRTSSGRPSKNHAPRNRALHATSDPMPATHPDPTSTSRPPSVTREAEQAASGGARVGQRRCGNCGEPGHYRSTCAYARQAG